MNILNKALLILSGILTIALLSVLLYYSHKVSGLETDNTALSNTVDAQILTISNLQASKEISDQVLSALRNKYKEQQDKNREMNRKLNELYIHNQMAKEYLDTPIPDSIISLLNGQGKTSSSSDNSSTESNGSSESISTQGSK